jgi:prevent-host-death family protein
VIVVGLRELRQDASALVRRAEDGEVIEITVAGRVAAQLTAVPQLRRRRFDELQGLFSGVDDPPWERDRDRLDDVVINPWERGDQGGT